MDVFFEKVLLSFSYSKYFLGGWVGLIWSLLAYLFVVSRCHIINCWLALWNDMTMYLEATPGSSDRTHFVMFLGPFHGLKGIQDKITYKYLYMRNRLNSSCRSLLVRRSFFLKGAPNHGKRYGELSKAIPCNILKYN